jgi:hypothetical protein
MELLPKLSEKEIQAELGYTYYELKKVYPNWSTELHLYGHIMDKNKLEIIFKKGIMLWYIKYHINNIINKNSIIPHNDIINIIYDIIEKKNIIKMGIVFQRWKIILEKIENHILGKNDKYMHNMFAISTFLDIIQLIIYHHIKYYIKIFNDALNQNNIDLFDNILNIDLEFYENELYFKILIHCINEDSFLNKTYERPESIDFNVMELVNQ